MHRIIMIIGLLMTVSISNLSAQENQPVPDRDSTVIVLLNSGASVKGVITVSIPGEEITVERASDGQLITIPLSRIFKITNESTYEQARVELESVPKKTSAFVRPEIVTTISMLYVDDTPRYGATALGGYYVGNRAFLSIGVSYHD